MPKRKRSYGGYRGAKRRKRTFKPRARRRTRFRAVPRGLKSQRRIIKMRYIEQFELNPGVSGTIAAQLFRANSVFDPNYTGTGHQPMFFDQMAALYNHYAVLGSKITVAWSHSAAATTCPNICGVFLSDDTTHSTAYVSSLAEQCRSSWKVIPSTYNVKPTRTRMKYSPKKFYNIKDTKDNLTRIGAAINANPTEEAYFVCYGGASDEGTDTLTTYGVAVIDYIVSFSEPKEIAQS